MSQLLQAKLSVCLIGLKACSVEFCFHFVSNQFDFVNQNMDHQRLTDTLNQLLAQAPRPSTPRPSAFRPNFRPQGPQGPPRLAPPAYGPNLPQSSPSPQYLNGVRLGPHLLKRDPQPEQPVLPIFSEKKIPYHELLLQPVRPLDKQPPPPQEVPQHFTLPLDGVPKRRVKRKPSQIPREPITINPDQPEPAPKRPDVAPKINRPPMQPPKNNIMQPIGHNGDKVFRIVEDKHKSHLHQSMDMMRTVSSKIFVKLTWVTNLLF